MENTTKQERRHRSRQDWEAIVVDYEQSGLTQKQFCQDRGLAYSTFMNWRARLRGKQAAPAAASPAPFIEVPLSGSTSPDWAVELQLGDHIVLRIQPG